MKLGNIITAVSVAVIVYALLFERERLSAMIGLDTGQPEIAASEAEMPASAGVPVVVQRSTAESVRSGLVLRGRTEAHRLVEVRAETTGTVISNPLPRGSRVAEEDLLCRLDPGTREASLAEANARFEEARLNAQAATRLRERGFGSETDAAARRAQLQAAQAQVEQAEKELARIEIRAPFAGLLETDTAELGALLQAGQACGTIVDLSRIRFVGFVPETDVHRVDIGSPAAARLLSGAQATGEISFISRSADALTKTFRTEFEVDNSSLNLPDGTTAEIVIGLAGEKAHFLPQAALTLDDAGRLGVRIVEADRAQFKPIDILRDEADGIWVRGLHDNADVIIVGQEFVGDSGRVRVTLSKDIKP